jgi:hypothetical protein
LVNDTFDVDESDDADEDDDCCGWEVFDLTSKLWYQLSSNMLISSNHSFLYLKNL